MKKWAAIWDSIGDSFEDRIGRRVYDAVYLCIADDIADFVMDTLTDLFDPCDYDYQDIQSSIIAFVWAYKASFLKVKLKYDLSPAIKLWNAGFFPSYDGNIWRLHGYNGKVLWKGVKHMQKGVK